MRISRPRMFMEVAHVVAKRSTCFRLNVGAVVVINNRIVSIGYNGRPSGEPHCQGNECPGKGGCHETIHAEDNALRYIPKEFKDQPFDLYVTDSPCESCAKKLWAYNVQRVFFGKPYRLTESLDWLIARGIPVYQVTPAGYIVDWITREVVDVV